VYINNASIRKKGLVFAIHCSKNMASLRIILKLIFIFYINPNFLCIISILVYVLPNHEKQR
jgi:hypothetical protein